MPAGEFRERDRDLASWRSDAPDAPTLTLTLKDTWDLVLTDGKRGRAFKAHVLSPQWARFGEKVGPIKVPPTLRGWLIASVAAAGARVDALLRPIRPVPLWP